MNLEARALGAQYVEQERALEQLIIDSDASDDAIFDALESSANILAKLRLTHLRAHRHTPEILTMEQLEKYRKLRGYDDVSNPCDHVPEGHDPDMWKRHNQC